MLNKIAWVKKTLLTSRKGIEDVIVSMIPQVFTVIVGLVTSILIARGLGPGGMGEYALIMSVPALVTGLSDLGVGQTAVRFASRAAENDDKQHFFSVLRWAFRLRMWIVILICVIVYFSTEKICSNLWNANYLTFLVQLSLFIAIFGAIASVPIIYFQSLKNFKMNMLVSVGQTSISLLGLLIIALCSIWDLKWIVIISVIAAATGAVLFFLMVPRETFIKTKDSLFLNKNNFNKTDQKSDVNSFALFMMISSIVVMLTMKADIWLMGFYLDKSEIGLYTIASRFSLPLAMLLGALNTALWPRASALSELKDMKLLLKKTFRISVAVSILGVIYSVFVPLLTPWIFGESYTDGILLGQILSIRYCIAILICPIGVIGYSLGMVRAYWWINILQFIAVITINLLFLPVIGPLASALALIVNEIVSITIVALIIRKKLKSLSLQAI